MKVVIDTNVLISAAWRDKSPEAVVLWIAFQDDWDWMVSQEILDEYREVLRREKFHLSAEVIEKWEYLGQISPRPERRQISCLCAGF